MTRKPDKPVKMILSMLRKDSLSAGESYLLQVDLSGFVYFAICVYKGGDRFAQEDGPDIDYANVVRVFEKPDQSRIVELW